MLRIGGMSLWRLLSLVFGVWIVVILFVTLDISTTFSAREDKDRAHLDRIEVAEKTVAELKSRNQELQRMLSSIMKSYPELNSIKSPKAAAGNNDFDANDDRPAIQKAGAQKDDQPVAPQKTSLDAPAAGIPLGSEDLFLKLSSEYKDLYNQVLESWFFLRNNLGSDKGLQEKHYDRYRLLLSHTERFRDILEPVKKRYAQNLSEIIFQRLDYLQNPTDCKSAKFAVCDIGKGCGFGCQIHHVAYCLMIAYATQRTLHLNGKPWSYAQNGFNSVFNAIGNTEKCSDVLNEVPTVDWNGHATDQKNIQIIKIPIVDSLHKKPNFMPMAIPEDMAPQLTAMHQQPFVWYVGHFLRYILRPLQSSCKSLLTDVENRFNIDVAKFDSIKPLVAIQVRRTDKLLSEAQFHGVSEYMKWVAEYYDQLEYKLGHEVTRSVYIATDEPSVLDDAKKEFPKYKFYCDPNIAKSAALSSRYTDTSLYGILIDMFWISRSDFVVCTFSSQVCRLGFALMQTLHGDAGDRFRSLDDIYYYGGQLDHMYEAVLPHTAGDKDEIDLNVGDKVHIAGNHWNGYSKGTNKKTGKHGLFPSYKVRDTVYVAKMPTYPEVVRKKGFALPEDSCLVV